MPRIAPLVYEAATPEARDAWDRHVSTTAAITNLKRTLLRSSPAFAALMQWYPLRDAVRPFLGERLTTLFAHAISSETDCLICSTFFRRLLIDAGENPDELALDPREEAVVAFGRCLAHAPYRVPDAAFDRLGTWFDEEQVVALTGFGALMVATNVVVNALEVPLDDYLEPYRRPEHRSGAGQVDGYVR